MQKALLDPPMCTAGFECHREPRGSIAAPGLHALDRLRPAVMAFEEQSADRGKDRGLAEFVGAAQHIQTIVEIREPHRVGELAKLLQLEATEFHRAALPF